MKLSLSFFDKYTIKARLLPAVTAILPLFFLLASYLNFNEDLLGNAIVLFLSSILSVFLLSNWSRSFGKKVEEKLLKDWGGLPTTQLLRFSDNTIDDIEKMEVHRILRENLGVNLPSKEEELKDRYTADNKYNVAINKVRELTRDDHILLNDNIYYGFMRNSLGIKNMALIFCVLTWLILAVLFYIHYPFDKYNIDLILEFSTSIRLSLWIALLSSVVMPIYWCFVITKKSVRNSAFRYARRVLLSIQNL